jgi:hypothetical protein
MEAAQTALQNDQDKLKEQPQVLGKPTFCHVEFLEDVLQVSILPLKQIQATINARVVAQQC